MHLTPKEEDKLKLLTLGLIAERRLNKGLKLIFDFGGNPENAVIQITDIVVIKK